MGWMVHCTQGGSITLSPARSGIGFGGLQGGRGRRWAGRCAADAQPAAQRPARRPAGAGAPAQAGARRPPRLRRVPPQQLAGGGGAGGRRSRRRPGLAANSFWMASRMGEGR